MLSGAKEVENRSVLVWLRSKYSRAKKRADKSAIIGEACERFSVSRKHAIRVLNDNTVGRPRNPIKRGRRSQYRDSDFKQALVVVWKLVGFPCGRVLKAAIPIWLGHIERDRGLFEASIRERLLSISAATVDRLLRPYKATRGRSYTRNGGFREEIPIQGNIWDVRIPGYMETDTASMCGGSPWGEFISVLTMVDIASIWTENRAVFGKGSNATFDAIRDIEHSLPFKIYGYDADNGGEVLNRNLYEYFYTERLRKGLIPVEVTRSRAYQKNDNAHVEQRNDTLVRRYLGYERMDDKNLVPLINFYFAKLVCPLRNFFTPSFKLSEKILVKNRTRRIYRDPITPYQRLIQSDHLTEVEKLRLRLTYEALDPVKLKREEFRVRHLINDCIKSSRAGTGMKRNVPTYSLWKPLLPQ